MSTCAVPEKKFIYEIYAYVYQQPPSWTECDTRSIFKENTTRLNSDFPFLRLVALPRQKKKKKKKKGCP